MTLPNLPNGLTLSRIFLVPLLVVVLLTRTERWELIGAGIFAVAAFTDWLDGYLARRRRQVTTLGTMLDPVADKVLVSAAFISLVQMGLAPAWMVVVIVGREFAVTGLRMVAVERGITIPASPLGKGKMATQVAAILLLILGRKFLGPLAVLAPAVLWITVGLALASGVDYFLRFYKKVSGELPTGSQA
ncbi:MAG TPA: CDP-diacylglycerol--glycerol-3-phosphate 3-phosphatidyltransferase [Vicinamibacteria bacterium]|nr:CDP-diacylglycerol--glycerol-3-phosphate 3-phosphatidyltransferase [Vicinamibacteria bacterium]